MNPTPPSCSLPSSKSEDCCGLREQAIPDQAADARVAGTAAVASVGAVASCAACCVIPLAFPAVAATAFGGLLVWLGQGQYLLTGLAVVIVAGAWAWIWRQSYRRRLARRTLWIMGLASFAAAVALAWPLAEAFLMGALGT